MHVFLAGVMQGGRQDHLIDEQNYRVAIAQALKEQMPDVRITDPWANNPDSVSYDLEAARHTFQTNNDMAGEVDLLIAYLPTASMGTAIEMWTAHHAGAYIIAVTPMEHNWVIRLTANEIVPDLDSLFNIIASGRLDQLPARRSRSR